MDAYSLLRAAAMVTAILAFAAAAAAALAPRRAIARAGVAAGIGSLILLAASTVIHVAIGHRPATDEALGLGAFIAEHPAMLVIGLSALAATAWSWRALS